MIAAGHEEQPAHRLDALRSVLSCGAPLTAGLARRVREFTDARLINGYGATETPQIASCHVVAESAGKVDPRLPDEEALPVGTGVAGAQLLVVDEEGAPCAVGQRGRSSYAVPISRSAISPTTATPTAFQVTPSTPVTSAAWTPTTTSASTAAATVWSTWTASVSPSPRSRTRRSDTRTSTGPGPCSPQAHSATDWNCM